MALWHREDLAVLGQSPLCCRPAQLSCTPGDGRETPGTCFLTPVPCLVGRMTAGEGPAVVTLLQPQATLAAPSSHLVTLAFIHGIDQMAGSY